MKQNLIRIPVRFNLNNPEHAEIVSILKDLNKNFHTSQSAFIIEALTYYIRNVSDSTLTNEGEERFKERAREFATREYVDNGLRELDRSLRLFVYERLEAGPIIRSSEGSDPNVNQTEEVTSEGVDLTKCDAVMRSIEQWVQ